MTFKVVNPNAYAYSYSLRLRSGRQLKAKFKRVSPMKPRRHPYYSSLDSGIGTGDDSPPVSGVRLELGPRGPPSVEMTEPSQTEFFEPLPKGVHRRSIVGSYLEAYAVLSHLGSGGYGSVHTARHRSSGRRVVTKCISKKGLKKMPDACWIIPAGETQRIPLEVYLTREIQHPNIIHSEEFHENKSYYQMVMEGQSARSVDLLRLCLSNQCQTAWDGWKKMDQPLVAYLFRQVLSAVAHLHQRGFIHQDIKPENILVDDQLNVKLIDFGLAAALPTDFPPNSPKFISFAGTPLYQAPESFLDDPCIGTALDVWSMGVALYQTLYDQKMPFESVGKIMSYQHPYEISFPESADYKIKDLIRDMLHPVPRYRMTLEKLAKDPWLNQPIDLSSYNVQQMFPSLLLASMK